MTSQRERGLDRRLFLGAAGALTLLGQPALAQEAKPAATPSKKLRDTIADFVVGFGLKTVPTLGTGGWRLAYIDSLAVMPAASREKGSQLVCEMVRQEEAAPKVSVV